jgi:hypothetical protein
LIKTPPKRKPKPVSSPASHIDSTSSTSAVITPIPVGSFPSPPESQASSPPKTSSIKNILLQLPPLLESGERECEVDGVTPALLTELNGISSGSPQKVDFTARYKKARVFIDELEEYFNLPPESLTDAILSSGGQVGMHSFLTCLSLLKTFSQYLVCIFLQTLLLGYCLMCTQDQPLPWSVFFSGGRDTISLCCASLKPKTIWTLMLVKQRLRLACEAIQDILGD